MKTKELSLVMILGLMLLLSFHPNSQISNANWEQGEIENIEDWIYTSKLVNVSQDYKIKLFFSYVNETLGIELYPNLSFHTDMNFPLNLTGYLSKKIKKEEAQIGIQVGSNKGNITLGINGSIIGITSITDTFIINIQEGESSTIANFDAFIGENLSIPIDFNPLTFSLDDDIIEEADSVSLSLTPNVNLEGSISLSAKVDGQKLTWKNNDEIFFEDVEVLKNMSIYDIELTEVEFNFEDVILITESIDAAIILHTAIGDIKYNFDVNFEDVEWEEGAELGGEFIFFILDTLLNIEDQQIAILIDEASFPFSSVLALLVIFTGFLVFKRRKRS